MKDKSSWPFVIGSIVIISTIYCLGWMTHKARVDRQRHSQAIIRWGLEFDKFATGIEDHLADVKAHNAREFQISPKEVNR